MIRAASAQEPTRGGTLVPAIGADPPTLNPWTTTDTQAWPRMGTARASR